MTNKDFRRIDAIRSNQGPVANHVIDEFIAGRLSRRSFISRGTIIGLSVPTIGALIAACSDDKTTATTTSGAPGDSTAPTTPAVGASGCAVGVPDVNLSATVTT